jgi:hypothetical protein
VWNWLGGGGMVSHARKTLFQFGMEAEMQDWWKARNNEQSLKYVLDAWPYLSPYCKFQIMRIMYWSKFKAWLRAGRDDRQGED